jgi:putative membrane protein
MKRSGSGIWREGWWHVKLLAVLAMTAFHMVLARHRRFFAEDQRRLTERQWRYLNEVPTVLMIAIVIMVIVKPF